MEEEKDKINNNVKDNMYKAFKKSVFILLPIFLVIILGCVYVSTSNKNGNFRYRYFNEESFYKELEETILYAYYNLKNVEAYREPSEILINEDLHKVQFDKNNYEGYKDNIFNFNTVLKENYKYRENIKYYAIDNKNNISTNFSGYSNVLGVVNNKLYDVDIFDMLKEYLDESKRDFINRRNFKFFIKLNFDNDGNLTINDIDSYSDNNKRSLENFLKRFIKSGIFKFKTINNSSVSINGKNVLNDIPINKIKNMDIVLAVPNYLNKDNMYGEIIEEELQRFSFPIGSCFIIILIILFFTLMVIPYYRLKKLVLLNLSKRLYFEVNIIVFILTIFLSIWMIVFMVPNTMNGNMANIVRDFNMVFTGKQLIKNDANISFLINILIWLVIFILSIEFIFFIRYIKNYKVIKYLKEKSMIGIIIRSINFIVVKISNYIKSINISDKNTRKIIFIVIVNFIIVAIMCSMWLFGIIALLIYSILLFYLLNKNIKEITKKYNVIKNVAEDMSNGNLDTFIEEDLGIFEPLKNQLSKIQRGFKKAVDLEVRSEKMRSEVITNVSHDLKTPLTSIVTYVDLLKNKNLTLEKREQYLDTLDRKSQKLQRLIEDLFEISKFNSGNLELSIEKIDIVSLIKQILFEFEDDFKKFELTIKENFSENKMFLNLDSQCTFRIFENLISNSIKYSLAKSRVYINVLEEDDFVVVIIKNITAQEIDCSEEQLTQRFIRGDKSRNTDGSGLGLAIVKSFVEAQGGFLKIDVDGDLFKVKVMFKKK